MSEAWRMSTEDAEEYTRALGQIMSGGWRQIALAQRLGVPDAIGMTTEAWVRDRIGGYVRLGLDERREAAKELTDPNGDFHLTQRQAAEVLGVAQVTVNRDLRDEPNGSTDGPPLEAEADTDDPYESPDGWAEPSVEIGLADITWERPDLDGVVERDGAEREQRQRKTRQFMDGAMLLWGSLFGMPEHIVETWVPETAAAHGNGTSAHLWTTDGLRSLAALIDAAATAIERHGGKLP